MAGTPEPYSANGLNANGLDTGLDTNGNGHQSITSRTAAAAAMIAPPTPAFVTTGELNRTRKHFSPLLANFHVQLTAAMPIQICALHGCYPSNFLLYVIFPVAKHIISKYLRLRVKMHRGSESEVLLSLSQYSLPPERVHADLGGGVTVDMGQFLTNRLQIEAAARGLVFPTFLGADAP